LITFYYALRHSAPLREQSHHFYLRIPLLGNKLRLINTARFARTLAILSSSGISILEAIHHASQLMTLIPLRKAIEEAAHRIREGASISLAFKQAALFPPMSLHLIASGETSGQLDNMLERAANNQENTIRQWIDVSLALFEPIMILVMGGMVLFIVLAIMLPIFQLNQ
jgi:general secretion pathway protein F